MLVPNLEVIQVHGLCVVGTPVGTSDYVREYVRNKCGTICKDVETMRIYADPLIRYHLLKFCMNTCWIWGGEKEVHDVMMSFICSFRNKNEPTAIYPPSGYSPLQSQPCLSERADKSGGEEKMEKVVIQGLANPESKDVRLQLKSYARPCLKSNV
jgi:hypothetical protein